MSRTYRKKGFSRKRANLFESDYGKIGQVTKKNRPRYIWSVVEIDEKEKRKEKARFYSDNVRSYGNVSYLKFLTKKARRANEDNYCKKVSHYETDYIPVFSDANNKRFIWTCF